MKSLFVNLRLSAKFGLAFGVCVLLIATLAYAAIAGLSNLNNAVHAIRTDSVAGLKSSGAIESKLYHHLAISYRIAGTTDANLNRLNKEELAKTESALLTELDAYKASIFTDEDRHNYEAVLKAWETYRTSFQSVTAALEKSDGNEAFRLADDSYVKVFNEQVGPAIDDLAGYNARHAEELNHQADQISERSQNVILTTAVLAVLLSVVAATVISRYIAGNLAEISARVSSLRQHCVRELDLGMRALAHGDLTVPVHKRTTLIDLTSKDEIGSTATNFNETLKMLQATIDAYNDARASLGAMVAQVKVNAASVAETSQILAAAAEQSGASSNEIAAGSERLAREASDAAGTVRGLSESAGVVRDASQKQTDLVQGMGDTLTRTASAFQDVMQSAESMKLVADEGRQAVTDTMMAMQRVSRQVELSNHQVVDLDKSGQEIGQIVATIANIADQTNLLALNAAIEAARAGEHGRGFSVVAEEVRKLAEQSRESTQQISQLIARVREAVTQTVRAIEGTNSEVQVGASASERAGSALVTILSAAEKVIEQNRHMGSLARTLEQQMTQVAQAAENNTHVTVQMAAGIEGVQNSIEAVASVSEESAAGAEELTATIEEVGAAASELAGTSKRLDDLVAQFKVESCDRPRLRIAA